MGTLYVVATPIGNLGDLSKRAIDTLTSADYILAEDTRQTIKLLNHFDIKNKMVSYHKYNESKRSFDVIEDLKNGKNVALVSDAGTPCISDPGYILVKRARKEGIEVIGVPGASAVINALSISGLDTSSFTFYVFVPTTNKEKKELFEEIKHSNVKTKVLYESPKRLIKLLEDINNEIPGCAVCVCSELTKVHESCTYGKIDEVLSIFIENKDNIKGEYVILLSNEPVNEVKENNISIESLLIDIVVKNNCSLKDAVNILNKENKNLSKKEIYNASLNLKNILN